MGSTTKDPVASPLDASPFARKGTITISRSLTEKRKDYVQRISRKNTQPQQQQSSVYGTLHRTFKSPHFETFSSAVTTPKLSSNDTTSSFSSSSSLSSNDDNELAAEDTPTTSERIKKYNQLLEASIRHHNHASPTSTVDQNVQIDVSPSSAVAVATNVAVQLFDHCLLIGFNSSTKQPYVKSAFPVRPATPVPPEVEQLVFPSAHLVHNSRADAQEYTVILTDIHGSHVYGYCRRVLPESCDICLPLAYCLISRFKAPGFFAKILQEIEQRHGQTDVALTYMLSSLQRHRLPAAGKFLHVPLPSMSPTRSATTTNANKLFATTSNKSSTAKRLSLEVNPRWLTDAQTAQAVAASSATSECTESNGKKSALKSLVQEFEEKKQQQQLQGSPIDLGLINRSLFTRVGGATSGKIDEILIKRPNDVRLESTELSDLYAGLGAELLCNVFASLLLERKVILYSRSITLLSACVMGLQTLLYPFQWQYTMITLLPTSLMEICQAPFPVLAGVLERPTVSATDSAGIEDGILVDLDAREMREKCGDEASILPSQLRRSLMVSLEMVDILDQGKMLSSVLIAEAFLRFFIELFAGQKVGDDFEVSFTQPTRGPWVLVENRI